MTTLGELSEMSKYSRGEFYIGNGRVFKVQNKPESYKKYLETAFKKMD